MAALQMPDGSWHHGFILPATYVSPVLVVVHLRVPDRRLPVHLILASDSASDEALRALRVFLRWRRPSVGEKNSTSASVHS